jgi:hypothetical protein
MVAWAAAEQLLHRLERMPAAGLARMQMIELALAVSHGQTWQDD